MKKTVLILYGGKSVEHEISIRSAKNVSKHINRELFDPVAIGISKNGDWFQTSGVVDEISTGKPVSIELSSSNFSLKFGDQSVKPDIVFPVLHGTDGEDGSVQGLFKTMDLAVVGTGVLGSATSMDKIITKKILNQSGINTSSFIYFDITQKENIEYEDVRKKIGLPMMVKSSNQGSSVGISKVIDEKSFSAAIEDSFRYSNQILIEEYISGIEVECAILGNFPPKSSIPGEIHIKKDYDFYTYEAKYVDEDAIDMIVPARISEKAIKKVRELSEMAFIALNCEDYARVDLFVTRDDEVFVNEINTIPGFTSASMFPVMWQNMGISYPDLITQLINLAFSRKESTQRLKTHYDKI